MTINKFGRIIANTRPTGLYVYLDGQPVFDMYGHMARTPVILNTTTGLHNLTFSKPGYESTNVMANVQEGLYTHVRTILTTKFLRFPNMLSSLEPLSDIELEEQLEEQTGDILIDSNPKGAYIYIDNSPFVDSSNNPILTPARATGVLEGQHMVEISMDGYYSKRLIINVFPNKLNNAYTDLQLIKLNYSQYGETMLQPKQRGTVFFDSQPHGAKIYVDGELLIDPNTEEALRTPTRVTLIEGRRDFTFVLEGHEDISGYVDVFPGTSVNIFRNMTPGKSQQGWGEPQPQIFLTNTGIIRIYSFPDGAEAYVNGRHVGRAPLTVTDVPAGVATVLWKMPGMMDEEKIVDIVEGAWSDAYATMRPVIPSLSYLYETNSNMIDNSKYIINNSKYIHNMQYYPISPDIPCVFPESPEQTATQGSLVITSYPPGAQIIMDGKTVIDLDTGEPLNTPIQLVMTMGYHDFTFQLDGFFDEYAGEYISPGHISFVHRNFNIC